MRLMDLYYKAFKSLRNQTQEDSNSQKLRKIISHSNYQNENFTATKYDCVIEVDWIENIEEGLIYVEKAIREDRQFIRTEGEVVPIEKVKKVSKTTVEHLSRHSDFITRAPKNPKDDLIPDKLYIVEKLSDFLVYENRFIYMLLCYLKDFIQMRLDKIKDKTTTYQSEMRIDKHIDASQRHLSYKLDFDEEYKNDPFLVDQYQQIPLVNRVETIYAIAVSLLQTPLMREVAKAPMIKPPVVKTNVLRMNPNFRAALKLYDYIMAYNKDGYEFKEIKKTFKPLPSEMSDEIAETIQLSSFITYMEGNGIREHLEERYQALEKEIKTQQTKKTKDEIKRLKKRIVEMHEDPAEYILKLERRNIELEKESMELAQEKEKNIELLKTIDILEKEKIEDQENIYQLSIDLSERLDEINQLNQKYFDDMTEAEEIHQKELIDLEDKHQSTIVSMNKKHESELVAIDQKHQRETLELNQKHEARVKELNNMHETKYQALIDQHKAEILALEEVIKTLEDNIKELEQNIEEMILEHKASDQAYEDKISELLADIDRLEDEKKYANAQYLALRHNKAYLLMKMISHQKIDSNN